MKIELYQYNCCIGVLSYENGMYVYNSNPQQEQLCKKKSFGCVDYTLWGSVNKQSKTLFPEFARWVSIAQNRKDIAQMAGIQEEDSPWEMLLKLGSLPGFSGGEAIKTISS